MSVVCDSNIYVSAIVFGGLPRDVLRLAEQNKVRLLVSPALIAEVEGVLERKFAWELTRVRRICQPLWAGASLIEPVSKISECRDANDNHLLALAVDGGATAVITGDRDLQVLDPFQGIRIVSPSQFLKAVTHS